MKSIQTTPYNVNTSKFHDIQEYRMRLQNNFGCSICLLGFSFIPFLHKNSRTRERYAFASCHNCGFSVCNLIIDFLPAQPGKLSEICRKPKLYIPGESCWFFVGLSGQYWKCRRTETFHFPFRWFLMKIRVFLIWVNMSSFAQYMSNSSSF